MTDLAARVFNYCERGLDPAFWAEPLNAVSNAGFIVAAGVAASQFLSMHLGDKPRAGPAFASRWPEVALIGLVVVIGVGSFLFHTFATRWAAIADGAPIGVFMLAYTGYALRRYLGWSWPACVAGVVAFTAAFAALAAMPCPTALRALVKGSGCLNGSLAYAPALATLALVAMAALKRRHPAAGHLFVATAAFAASLAFRSLDQELCGATLLWNRPRGTHALWHLLNALTLGLLLIAAVRHGRHGGNTR